MITICPFISVFLSIVVALELIVGGYVLEEVNLSSLLQAEFNVPYTQLWFEDLSEVILASL